MVIKFFHHNIYIFKKNKLTQQPETYKYTFIKNIIFLIFSYIGSLLIDSDGKATLVVKQITEYKIIEFLKLEFETT